jgi:hypothetical protein
MITLAIPRHSLPMPSVVEIMRKCLMRESGAEEVDAEDPDAVDSRACGEREGRICMRVYERQ